MSKIVNFFMLCTLLFALCLAAEAQQPRKIPLIGRLTGGSPSNSPARLEAFRQGLRELGYVEGENIVIEYRFAMGNFDRLPDLAAELVRLKVDVIVAQSSDPVRAATNATKTIPIVMVQAGDPVGNRFIDSLARPGGNVTGLTTFSNELAGKRIELFKEAFPKIRRLAVLWNQISPGSGLSLKQTESAAQSLGLQLQVLSLRGAKDFETAFSAIRREGADAILVLPDSSFFQNRIPILEFAARNRLPTMYPHSEFLNDSGLMSYGTYYPDLNRRAATYVDKILKGAKPADLPVEQPKKFELVINLKAAKQIGVTIPPTVLMEADKVIK